MDYSIEVVRAAFGGRILGTAYSRFVFLYPSFLNKLDLYFTSY
jgi:hypothetical protein